MGSPAVSGFSPDPSIAITTTTPVAFNVTDTTPFREIIILVKMAGVPWEVAYDGSAFGPNYSTLSTKASITNGFTFRLRRDEGWAAAPVFAIHAIDTSGSEAT